MASTTALFTGLSGLNASARNLDVIGNNIANANTTAFKSSRMLFSNAFSRTFSIGSVPSENSGGTNPGQIGLGVMIAGTQRDMSSGALSATGDARDLAIEGNGFFAVRRGDSTLYTRAGAFRQNANNDLVNIDGDRLQGYGVDADFNIVPGALQDLNIPLGQLTLARATSTIELAGNLNAGGALPTRGSRINFGALSLVSGPIGGPGGNALDTSSLLTDINDASSPGNPLFSVGQTIELNGAEKGNRTLPTADFAVTPASTVQDFMNFLSAALGISTASGNNPDGNAPGVTLDPPTGVISVTGNSGTANDITLELSDLRLLNSGGTFVRSPLTPTQTATADGESVRTTMLAYDSLGTPVTVDLTMTLESRGSSGTTWRYYVESGDDSDVNLQLATGTLDFDVFGQLQTTTPATVQMDRTGAGSADPLSFTLNFAPGAGGVTALTDDSSTLAATAQDGVPIGTLADFGVGTDGVITGAFSNGITRTIGQVVLATFANPEGLVDEGSNLYSVGPNSGTAAITEPNTLGAGRIVGGSLELSNVDLSEEFINMILTSTGYSANARVITTTDQLFQQLLVLGR
jgi:flagellar hook protein FlgE